MTSVICDSCKKSIPGPHRDVNYKTLLNKDLCLPCVEKLEAGVKELMAREKSFHMEDHGSHQKMVLSRLTK